MNGPWSAWGWELHGIIGLGYIMNPVSYSAVNIISDAVSGVPWILYRKTSDDRDVQIEQAPVLDLLKKPAVDGLIGTTWGALFA